MASSAIAEPMRADVILIIGISEGSSYAARVDLEQQARRIATAVRDAGGRALCVGGFVRDRLLHLRSQERTTARQVAEAKDLDIEVFGIEQGALHELLKSLGRVEPVGQAFPVYKLGEIDVAMPRRESKTGRG